MTCVDQLQDGIVTIAAPGTPVALSAGTLTKAPTRPVRYLIVTALSSNTAPVAVGGSGVRSSATAASNRGRRLSAGQSTESIPVNDLSKVFVDAQVIGEGVSFTYGY